MPLTHDCIAKNKKRSVTVKQDVLYSKEDGTGTVTLNCPQKLRALTHEMLHRLNSIIGNIRKDDEVRASFWGKGTLMSVECAGLIP